MNLQEFVFQLAVSVEKTKQYLRNRYPTTADVVMTPEVVDNSLLLMFQKNQEKPVTLTVPLLVEDEVGNTLIQTNDRVFRAAPEFMLGLDTDKQTINFYQLLLKLFTVDLSAYVPNCPDKGWLQILLTSFHFGTANKIAHWFQRFLSTDIISMFPIHETNMKTFVTNNRVTILDPEFEALKGKPDLLLNYRAQQQLLLFPWTFSGLSESALVLNYMLKLDLKKYTPFAVNHHNPQRNLFQPLGMVGTERAALVTKSSKELQDRGLEPTGYNLMTAFVDYPILFEDQIVISDRLQHLVYSNERHFMCFGEVQVKVGDKLEENQTISIEPDKELKFKVKTDEATVIDIEPTTTLINGQLKDVNLVTVEMKSFAKDGFKFTNRHGNKGIVYIADTGLMADPKRDCCIPVDVIVSGSSVKRRKNFGQLYEALYTLIHGIAEQQVISDDATMTVEELSEKLIATGYASDGTCEIVNPFGEARAICGWVFWGIVKTPDNQVWSEDDTQTVNNMQLRTKGIKVSTIEMSAMITMFGPSSSVIKEILSYQEGSEDVREQLKVLDSLRGLREPGLPVESPEVFALLGQDGKSFFEPAELEGSVTDETIMSDGGYIELPLEYKTFLPDSAAESPLEGNFDEDDIGNMKGKLYSTKYLRVPTARLRGSWQHQSGLKAMTPIATSLNRVLLACEALNSLKEGEPSDYVYTNYYKSIGRYYHDISSRLSTKRGDISTYSLAVRYPNSTKAVAALSDSLPPDTIEIHGSVAKELGIKTGDHVLVERFPCLGFPSVRVQKVQLTYDNLSKSVIRVSGNSLVSQALDFDGDVIYVMAFNSPRAKQELEHHMNNMPKAIKEYIDRSKEKKQPKKQQHNLVEYEICKFAPLTAETQAMMASKAVGVKAHTGTVIALCYDLMRIIETTVNWSDTETRASVEIFMDRVGNSVFSQKHGVESMQSLCVEAICKADVDTLVYLGFPQKESMKLCDIIKQEAASIRVFDLGAHWNAHIEKGSSNIIKTIIRYKHPVYFATRANLHPLRLLAYLARCETEKTMDLVTRWFKKYTWKNGLVNNYIIENEVL